MLTYVIRRLIYSTVVLFAASVLVFWGMSLVTSPVGFLRMQPNISEQTIQNISERKHLDEPIHVRYGVLGQGRVHEQVRNRRPCRDLPILARTSGARWSNTLQLIVAAQLLAIFFAVLIGRLLGLYASTACSTTRRRRSASWGSPCRCSGSR